MEFAFTSEQQMLRDTVRSFLADKAPVARTRELMETERGLDDGLWQDMAAMGLAAMHVPESMGGAGSGHLELGIVLEELGRTLTPSPLVSSVVLGASLVMLAGTEDQQKELLPGVAAGERRLAVALVDEGGGWDVAPGGTRARRDGDGWVLDGVKDFVIDGHTAQTLLIAARDEDGELGFFAVDGSVRGVGTARLETMDMTRKQGRVELRDVAVPRDSRLAGEMPGDEVLARLYDAACVAIAFESVGGAQRCMEMSVEYAKVRYQFGRPIGSFQAIKHKCADMLVKVEAAKSAAYYAGWAAGADEGELAIVAPLAKAYCTDAFFFCAAENIQIHGGIGFTWEHDAHLYFKRAKTNQLLFGDPAHWRAVLADRIGL